MAAIIAIAVDEELNPIALCASTLIWYVVPGIRPVKVYDRVIT